MKLLSDLRTVSVFLHLPHSQCTAMSALSEVLGAACVGGKGLCREFSSGKLDVSHPIKFLDSLELFYFTR